MSGAGGSRSKAARKPSLQLPRGLTAYLGESETPFASLVFLLPLLVLYEIGTWMYASYPVETRIRAFQMLRDFFWFFRATGRYLPALAVAGILLGWHMARRDRWQVRMATVGGMALESTALALPLIAGSRLAARYIPLYAPQPLGWQGQMVLSVGAGIYEELVFRLMAFTVLNILLIDAMRMPRGRGYPLIVVISAILFAVYHYWGNEQFLLHSFAFRTAAGVYFGVLFLWRGFGITVGAHAFYDILTVISSLLIWP